MKQFPWREYFWVVLLLSLAIGLAVELQRVRKLSEFREQSIQAEEKARELAWRIAAATDSQVQFGDPQSPFNLKNYAGFDRIYFVANDGSQRIVRSVRNRHVRRTDERSVFPDVTGMSDLDALLVTVPVTVLVIAVLTWLLPWINAKRTVNKRDIQTLRRWGYLYIPISIFFSIFNYRGMSWFPKFESTPYAGAFFLISGALFIPRYLHLCSLSEEEHAQWLTEAQANYLDIRKFRESFRFQLRDIFWLMLAIGLASTIFVEHRRGRDLMPYRGTAEWWSNATEELQKEYDKLPAALTPG